MLKAVPDGFDPAKVQLAIQTGSGTALVPPSSLSGGSIAGLLRFQNSDLTAANNLVGQMAYLLTGLALVRAPRGAYTALGAAPVYIVWKIGLYAQAMLSNPLTR